MPTIRFGRRSIKLPSNRAARIGLGGAFVAGGLLSFLPVLGVWMLPLGMIILSHDFARVRRMRRRSEVGMIRRWRAWRRKPVPGE
ncbi:hypothetical protein [Prosthecomicrobium pneumaticum]|uniref:Transmembrane protein (PGPGW) n=1 Tax=Prosthecomicrobium pneumaticum TaxID=81895 RepID=A0A7W9FPU6_9HYPH|nr:hypothetical protein [Prosthecomicrobium pneumaticum]MBB5754576.1 hypothetical protein [Prosthecomicrobium pneumaticum]